MTDSNPIPKRRKIAVLELKKKPETDVLEEMIKTRFTVDLTGGNKLSKIILKKTLELELDAEEQKKYDLVLNSLFTSLIGGFFHERVSAKIASKLQAVVLLYLSDMYSIIIHDPVHGCVKNVDDPGSDIIRCAPGSERYYRTDLGKYCTREPESGNAIAFANSVLLKPEDIIQFQHMKNSVCKQCLSVGVCIFLKV